MMLLRLMTVLSLKQSFPPAVFASIDDPALPQQQLQNGDFLIFPFLQCTFSILAFCYKEEHSVLLLTPQFVLSSQDRWFCLFNLNFKLLFNSMSFFICLFFLPLVSTFYLLLFDICRIYFRVSCFVLMFSIIFLISFTLSIL